MFTVYILKNSMSGRHCIDSTNYLVRRLSEHNRGYAKSTRQKGNWEVIYTEQYSSELEARKREKIIKSYKGGSAFKKLFVAVVQW